MRVRRPVKQWAEAIKTWASHVHIRGRWLKEEGNTENAGGLTTHEKTEHCAHLTACLWTFIR